jgi:hypothetical protein
MHDTKKASVDLSRGEMELVLQLLAAHFAKTSDAAEIVTVSNLYNTLNRAKVGL